ncbi:MAG: DUF3833 domain-containing protein [Ramlibacter sp.]
MKRRAMLLAGTGVLAGCAGVDVADYAGQQPALDLRAYFNGRVEGHGIFTDRGGKVVKRFVVLMDCRWDGDAGVLDEDFTYSDGTKQRRVWRVTKLADGRYTGRADDVVGEAQGQARGNALRWNYTLVLPVDGRNWEVQMDDWMYLMDAQVLLNRTRMTKLGIHLGDVTLSFRKRP